jgi:hypothetical protein
MFVVGSLLIVAAVLKLSARVFEPVQRMGLFSLQSIQVGIVNLEIILALWIWSRLYSSLSWLTTFTVFACFAGVSGYQGWLGESSCGCFGKLPVHPWVALGLDLGVLLALLAARPGWEELREESHHLRSRLDKKTLLLPAVALGLFILVAAGYGYMAYGSFASAMAHLKGESITVDPIFSDLGTCRFGEQREFAIRVTNHRNEPIRIVGQPRGCSCQIVSELPLTIPPGDSREVNMMLVVLGEKGVFTQERGIFVDSTGLDELYIKITGRIEVKQ